MPHQWDPDQYEKFEKKFEKERAQPFFDLLQLIHPLRHPRILDIGCGYGTLTQIVHEKFHASFTLGIDTSKEMLAKASALHGQHLLFKEQDVQTLTSDKPFNLIISNAALHWVPHHENLFKKLTELLAPAGQLAIQMPAIHDYPTHVIAVELAAEEPFRKVLKNQNSPLPHLISMEQYAHLFEKLGYESQIVRLQLYAHFLESTASVIEWMKCSILTYYKSHLSSELYTEFLKEYQKRLIQHLGWSEPFFFPIKRLFLWGQLPDH